MMGGKNFYSLFINTMPANIREEGVTSDREIMPQEKKIQVLVKFDQFISLSLIDYHRVNNSKYTFYPSR